MHDSSRNIRRALMMNYNETVGILGNFFQNSTANFKRKRVSKKTKRGCSNSNRPQKEIDENTVVPKPPFSKLGFLC